MLTTNAKASGRKLTLTVIKDLDKDRQPWMAEVVLKSGLLGTHDTIRTRWLPQDRDYQVKITGMAQKTKSQSTLKTETLKTEEASSTSLLTESGESYAQGASGDVKREKRESSVQHTLYTPDKTGQIAESVETEGEENDENEGEDDEEVNRRLAVRLQRMEIENRMRELAHVQLLRDAELERVRGGGRGYHPCTCRSNLQRSLRVTRE